MLIVPSIAGAGGTGLASEAGGAPPPAWGDALSPCSRWVLPPGCACLSPLEAGADRGLKAICELG